MIERVTEKSRESQSGSLRPSSTSERAKNETVLSRSVKIRYLLSQKCRLCAVNEMKKRADPEVYSEMMMRKKYEKTHKVPNYSEWKFLNEPRIIGVKWKGLFRLLLSCYEGAMISSILHCQANIHTNTNKLTNANTNVLKNSNLVLPGKCKHNDKQKPCMCPQAKNKGITPIWYLYAMASVQLLQVANFSAS